MDGIDAPKGWVSPWRRGSIEVDPGALVARLVEDEVIPRLLLTRRLGPPERRPGPGHVETLTRLLLSREPAAAGAQIAALRDAGAPLTVLLTDLVTPAARRLGDLWLSDAIDFVDVALAAGRLTTLVRGSAPRIEAPGVGAAAALVASLPGQRHELGVAVFAQTLRVAGWRVREARDATAAELAALATDEDFALVGLSLGAEAEIGAATEACAALRWACRGRRTTLAVGGPLALTTPDLAVRVGADFAAVDAAQGVALARQHLSRPPEPTKYA